MYINMFYEKGFSLKTIAHIFDTGFKVLDFDSILISDPFISSANPNHKTPDNLIQSS